MEEEAHLNEQAAEHKKRDSKRREKTKTARDSAMRQACLAKTRSTGKDRVITAEEKK